jgi:hypothetical protein
MDDLLIKYILEETTPEETGQAQQWLAANAANRAHFERLQAVWQLATQPNLQRATDTPQALQRLKQTLKARETVPRTRDIKRTWRRVWTAAAAAVGIAGMALGAYVWMKPKTTVKELPPFVQPDTVLQKPVRVDTLPTEPPVPAVQPVPALPADTIPFVKPHKKKHPAPVTPVQPVHRKKKAPQQPTQPTDTIRVKKKHPVPVKAAHPVKKHKSASKPIAPHAPVKELLISSEFLKHYKHQQLCK